MSKKILIIESTAGGGHLSITDAITAAILDINPQHQVIREDVNSPLINKIYNFSSNQLANLHSLAYKATDTPLPTKLAAKFHIALQKHKFKKIILRYQPDVIINQSPLATQEVPYLLKELKLDIPYLIFIPDPITFHQAYISKQAELTMVATPTAYQSLLNAGISPQRIIITGHPIRPQFYTKPSNLKSIRTQYHLESFPTILFGGSGEGADKTLEIILNLGATPSQSLIRQLLKSTAEDLKSLGNRFLQNRQPKPATFPPFQALFVTGNNHKLRHQLEELTFPANIIPHIIGYTQDMPNLIHLSDVIVGKAGPNLLFETCAAKKTFIASSHVKGQEDGNLELIRGSGCGFVAEKPPQAASLIAALLNQPKLFEHTKPGIELLRKQNQQAAHKIAQTILSYIDK